MQPANRRNEVVLDRGDADVAFTTRFVAKQRSDFPVVGREPISGKQFDQLLPYVPIKAAQQVCENRLLFLLRDESRDNVLRRKIAEIHEHIPFYDTGVGRTNLTIGVKRNPVTKCRHVDQTVASVSIRQGIFALRIENQQAHIRWRRIKLGNQILDQIALAITCAGEHKTPLALQPSHTEPDWNILEFPLAVNQMPERRGGWIVLQTDIAKKRQR